MAPSRYLLRSLVLTGGIWFHHALKTETVNQKGSFLTLCEPPAHTNHHLNYKKIESSKSEEELSQRTGKMPVLGIVSGTASTRLACEIARLLGTRLEKIEVKRFSDGEIFCTYQESVRGRRLYIIQSCSPPVNDNIMELLLLVTAARRAGANKITAVIPYFGYKYHRRGTSMSTKHQSRFLWSTSADFAKLLQSAGVDNVIAVDLQRPGQGHEGCFFDNMIPVETIHSTRLMADYCSKNFTFENPLVVVASNAGCMKKTIVFRDQLVKNRALPSEGCKHLSSSIVEHALFIHSANESEFLGNVMGCDVIIIDEVVETANSLATLCHQLKKRGAEKIYLCASHGLFTKESMSLIDLSPVEKVVVTDTVDLSSRYHSSEKIIQVTTAKLIAHVIDTDYFVPRKEESETLEVE